MPKFLNEEHFIEYWEDFNDLAEIYINQGSDELKRILLVHAQESDVEITEEMRNFVNLACSSTYYITLSVVEKALKIIARIYFLDETDDVKPLNNSDETF